MTRWVALVALVAALSLAGEALGLPSPELFGAMVAGVVVALASGVRAPRPAPAVRIGSEAAIGVVLGTYVALDAVREVGAHLAPIVAVTVGTLALTGVAGVILARWTGLDAPTASLGMIAGGATGVIPLARHLGADERLVAVMQYLRVLVVVALTPLVAAAFFGATDGAIAVAAEAEAGVWTGAALTLVVAAAGVLAARALPRVPAGALLGPMLLAAALTLSGVSWTVPGGVQVLAFAVIGASVGLAFTPASLRRAGSILGPALVMVVVLLAACAAMGLALAPLAGVSQLDAYLATTPGGLYAVLAVAVGSGSDTTFVLAVQVLRLFVMLLAAPWFVTRFTGRPHKHSGIG